MSKEKTKVRIMQREDGAIYAWTQTGADMPGFVSGWMYTYEDGAKKVILDRATRRQMDPATVSQREKNLIEENAKLREQLAASQGMMEPGETPLPPMDGMFDLTNPEKIANDDSIALPMEDEKIELPEGVPILERKELQGMKKDELMIHAHKLNPQAEIPERADKLTLIEFCMEMQKRATA